MGRPGLILPTLGQPRRRCVLGAETIESLLIVVVAALAIRTFFLQPARIPTASMQPTLHGVIVEPSPGQPGQAIPTGWRRLWQRWGRGVVDIDPGGGTQGGSEGARRRIAGDHILIDRLTYNFRRPRRGEIIVFATVGLRTSTPGFPEIPQDQLYTKRLIGLPGEQVRIDDGRHVVVDRTRLDEKSPHFQAIYSFDPRRPAHGGEYSGHLNAATARASLEPGQPNPAPWFPDQDAALLVRPGHVLVLGDNSLASLDGRAWGDFPERQILGKVACVYWPVSERWLRLIP
jgi:signal peptidase I